MPTRQDRKSVSHGKESSKFNGDCTICRPCQSTTSDSAVRNRGNTTPNGGYVGLRAAPRTRARNLPEPANDFETLSESV